MTRHRTALATVALGASMVMGACAGGGASDTVGARGRCAAGCRREHRQPVRLRRAEGRATTSSSPPSRPPRRARACSSSSPTEPPATSRARSRPGAEADFVNFSVEPDITRLVDAGLVDATGTPTSTTASRSGRSSPSSCGRATPRTSRTGTTCSKPGVEVVTPNPFSSGSAKWNLLAPYADQEQRWPGRRGRASTTSPRSSTTT